jgi:alkylation response protein AidB-like acyl-CoA dehydrogenase
MDAATDERDELRSVARRVLEKESSSARVRRFMEDPAGDDADVWQTMAALGWLGLELPEDSGGAGCGFVELGVVLEELGRHVTPGPFVSTVVLGAAALAALADDERRRALLSELASGGLRVAVVGASADGSQAAPTFRASNAGFVLDGTTGFVLDGARADLLVVIARPASGDGAARAFLVPADAPGLARRPMKTIDQTRHLAEITFDGVTVGPDDSLAVDGDELATRLLDRAATALACDSVGGARRVMEMCAEYATVREQFGRPIGTFQAIKHKCADMLVLVETAQVAAEDAAAQLAAEPGEAGARTSIAKWYACDAYAKVAGDGIQVHGGIGFTWDHDLQLFFKRAKLNQALFGNSLWHRRRLADQLLPRPHA